MKEKVLFIASMIGSFSAITILLINYALNVFGIDTSEYIDIINIVGVGLAAIILIVGVVYLNKYNTLQQKRMVSQNNLINTTLDNNATLMNTLLPKLANDIMNSAEERSQQLLLKTEAKVNSMMNEMLPALAQQTMQVVTEKSQNIVEQTTAKANETIARMDELIPTYAKNISDQVAQTVRENNAHYHKMLTELKGLYSNLPATNSPAPVEPITVSPDALDAISDRILNSVLDGVAKLNIAMDTKLAEVLSKIAVEDTQNDETDVVEPIEQDTQHDETDVVEPIEQDTQNDETDVVEPIEQDTQNDETDVVEPIEQDTQNDETSEESDETETA